MQGLIAAMRRGQHNKAGIMEAGFHLHKHPWRANSGG